MVFPPGLADRVVRDCGRSHGSCHGLGSTFADVHLMVPDQCYNTNTGVAAEGRYHTAQNPLYLFYARIYDYDDAVIDHTPGAIVRVRDGA